MALLELATTWLNTSITADLPRDDLVKRERLLRARLHVVVLVARLMSVRHLHPFVRCFMGTCTPADKALALEDLRALSRGKRP